MRVPRRTVDLVALTVTARPPAPYARGVAACVATFLGLACGGGGGASDGGGTTGPAPATFTTLDVDLAAPTLFLVGPGTTTTITPRPKDQRGGAITGGTATFASDAPAVATVDATGIVTARAVGTARVMTTLTIGGVTRSAQSTVSVVDVPRSLTVSTTPQLQFAPAVVDIAAGGAVTWTSPVSDHNVIFATPNAPPDIPTLLNGVAVSRTFTTSGTYDYSCTVHAGMSGVVRVH